jgi:hypothetical protein
LSILQGAVEASLLVRDDRPVMDTLAWQRATLAAHRLSLAEAIAHALEKALETSHPEAAGVLGRARGRAPI